MKSTKSNYTITRETHKIDATDVSVGRLATKIAFLLRGKHKPSFTPQVDNGDFVVVKNAKNVKLTGKKTEQKVYYRHSGFPGGLKTVQAKDLMENNPAEIIERAVFSMLPNSKLRNAMVKRLTVKN